MKEQIDAVGDERDAAYFLLMQRETELTRAIHDRDRAKERYEYLNNLYNELKEQRDLQH